MSVPEFGCWWYLSFANDEKFLGAVCVYGMGDKMMLMTLGSLNLNPGGEVVMHTIPEGPPKKWRGRLLSKEEIEEMDREILS
jgi:hypothetical protein